MKKMLRYLPSLVFCGFIFTFMILFIVLPKAGFSEQEKRNLASFPEVPKIVVETEENGEKKTSLNTNFFEDVNKFQTTLDTYLSDHTPGREFFVGLNADYNLVTGRNGKNGIFLGSDGYLFPEPTFPQPTVIPQEDKKDKTDDKKKSDNTFNKAENFLKNAGFVKEFADSVDIPVYMTLIPSSGFVNSDKLPLLHKEYNDGEMIKKYKDTLGNSVIFTDVTDHFVKNSDKQLYYRTDHHWTSRGAYECYSLLGKTMGYEPVSEKMFSTETLHDFYGTSYSKGALWFVQPDDIELWRNKTQPQGSVTVEIKDGADAKQHNDYFFKDQLKNMDKYPVFLDGNHSFVRVTNTSVPEGKLIVVKDSYAHSIVPFLSQNYREIIMVDLRYYKREISALAAEEKADAVLVLYSIDNMANDINVSYLF